MRQDWKKYVSAFLITTLIFFTAISISNYFGNKKIEEIRSIQDKISLNILSSETQFAILEEFSCKKIGGSVLAQELSELGEKLSYTEDARGSDDPEVMDLKTYYSLLQIKDFLLMKKINTRCGIKPVSILYFYSNKGDCPDCEKEGLVLTKLHEDHADLRVYSFDYNIEVPAVQTIISLNKIENKLPALYINDNVYYGFQSIEDIQKIVPALKATTTSATSTASKK